MSKKPKHHHRSAKQEQREDASGYWIYGRHAVEAVLANPKRHIKRLVATQAGAETIATRQRIETVPQEAIANLLPRDAVHQGLAVQVEPLADRELKDVIDPANPRPVVMLDQVTDPHNVGAIMRSAAAFDAAAVVLPRAHAPQEGGALAKAASGALETVPLVRVGNLVEAMKQLKKMEYWCVGLDGEATTLMGAAKLGPNTALVLGAEGKGLRRLTGEHCDLLVRLPISAKVESLNVSNAAAIALYILGAAGG